MSPWALFVLAVGVSADAFAVALGKGLQLRRHVMRGAFLIAGAFGVAQAVMPLLGWLLGSTFAAAIAPFDHWIAFALLAAIGGKMLWEAFRPGDDDDPASGISAREIALLALATSIDALAVGLSFAFLDVPLWIAVVSIGLVTFVLSFVAVLIGHRVGTRWRRPAEIIGGIVLIGIGTQILIEHLLAG